VTALYKFGFSKLHNFGEEISIFCSISFEELFSINKSVLLLKTTLLFLSTIFVLIFAELFEA
tara:strand:- start:538 stop:723 length:186 start_codon:yes stop_codon:yes gene_type:complete